MSLQAILMLTITEFYFLVFDLLTEYKNGFITFDLQLFEAQVPIIAGKYA